MDSHYELASQPDTIPQQSTETPTSSNLSNPFKKIIFLFGIYLLLLTPTFYALINTQKVFGIDIDTWYLGWKMFSLSLAGIILWLSLMRKKRLWSYIILVPFFLLTGWAIIIDFLTLRPIRIEIYFLISLFTTGLLLLSREFYFRFIVVNKSRLMQTGDITAVNSSRWLRTAITLIIIIVIIILTTRTIAHLLELKTYPRTPPITQKNTRQTTLSFFDVLLTITMQPTKDVSTPSPTSTQARPTALLVTYRNEKLGFEFKHIGYHIIEETASKVSLGVTVPDLTISINRNTDYKSHKFCNETNNKTPCLESGERWGQKEDIAGTTLGQVSAKSFYMLQDNPYRYNPYSPPHEVYHIVQTNDAPKIEAKMRLANSAPESFDLAFKQMLSTFKILDDM